MAQEFTLPRKEKKGLVFKPLGGRSGLLEPGDALLLLTDGIVEATDATGRCFGPEQLAALASELRGMAAEEIIRQIVRATREFSGAVDFEDDVTLVVVRRESPQPPRADNHAFIGESSRGTAPEGFTSN